MRNPQGTNAQQNLPAVGKPDTANVMRTGAQTGLSGCMNPKKACLSTYSNIQPTAAIAVKQRKGWGKKAAAGWVLWHS